MVRRAGPGVIGGVSGLLRVEAEHRGRGLALISVPGRRGQGDLRAENLAGTPRRKELRAAAAVIPASRSSRSVTRWTSSRRSSLVIPCRDETDFGERSARGR